MLNDKRNKERNTNDPSGNQNRINEGTSIVGDIASNGFFRIDGTIKGNVTTPSKVVIGQKGKITGTLTCEQADIEGAFEGNLIIKGLLSLRATARITGDLVVGKLSVEPGATLDATCKMSGGVKSMNTQDKGQQKERTA